jgi:hypothetical protein
MAAKLLGTGSGNLKHDVGAPPIGANRHHVAKGLDIKGLDIKGLGIKKA